MTIEDARRSFAEELRFVAHLGDQRVVDAFAAVPRERFVGPGPWRILHMGNGYWSTPDADPRHLYHNVLVALDESTGLNTGEPSLWAYHFDRLGIRAGDRVLQIGAGSGYFTAILAEIVGRSGKVLGLEVEPRLAAAAQGNLADWPQASARLVEGIVPIEGKWDVVVAFAGTTAPTAAWLNALDDGGRALIPMTGPERWGFILRLDRHGAGVPPAVAPSSTASALATTVRQRRSHARSTIRRVRGR
jgi:protein-L-isoaspartate(D-aspartate) O-methyltransferase